MQCIKRFIRNTSYGVFWGVFATLCATVASGQVRPEIRAFNAGELSPYMLRRSDTSKYDNGAKTLENMLILSQGPAVRRPGTKYIATVKTSADEARLIPFEYSKTDSYVLEFGDLYMRVYRNGGQVLDGASAYELVTPFTDDELFEIHFVQVANSMYMVHGDHQPQKLTRAGHTSWTIADVDFQTGPFLAQNTTTTSTIAASATTGTVTLTAAGGTPFVVATHPNSLWRINHRVESSSVSGSLTANGSSSTLAIGGAFDFTTQGTWTGTVTLERSTDGSTWNPTPGWAASVDDENIDYSSTETEAGVTYRVTMSNYSSGTATYNLARAAYTHIGIVDVTAVASTTSATATVLTDLASTDATYRWSEGAWSDYREWPETLEVYERRMFYGGSESYPQTVWASKTADGSSDDYENFLEGVDDDDALIYILPGQNAIQWMSAQTYLLVGTMSGVGRWGSDSDTSPITPTNPTSYRMQARHGAAYIQAVLVGDAILYVERGGDRVREFVYTLERDRFIAPDLTVLSEHITGDGIIDIAYQSRPDSTLWCVLADGDMATLTFQREQEVVGWTRQVTDGDFESVCVVPSTDEDEVWAVVNRTINGSTVRYVEQFQPRDWGSDQHDAFFVDSGLTYDGGDTVAITNITQADPAVITVSSWPEDASGTALADGDQIKIVSVGGMTELNDNIYTVDDADSVSTFSLDDSASVGNIDSSGFTAYTTGGTVQEVERDFTTLSHLEGETVAILGDGVALQRDIVASGDISLELFCNVVQAGLPFTSKLETMPIVLSTQQGSTSGKQARITSVAVDFYQSLGTKYGLDDDSVNEITFYDVGDDVDDPIALFTGWRVLPFLRGLTRDLTVYLEQDEPLPMEVRAIAPTVEITER